MRTNINFTYEILEGYLQNDNHINVEYLAEQISILAENDTIMYNERFNTRRKVRNIAINELMFFINTRLKYHGYRDFYATNKQVMKFDKEHYGDLEKVLDILETEIINQRNEVEEVE